MGHPHGDDRRRRAVIRKPSHRAILFGTTCAAPRGGKFLTCPSPRHGFHKLKTRGHEATSAGRVRVAPPGGTIDDPRSARLHLVPRFAPPAWKPSDDPTCRPPKHHSPPQKSCSSPQDHQQARHARAHVHDVVSRLCLQPNLGGSAGRRPGASDRPGLEPVHDFQRGLQRPQLSDPQAEADRGG